MARSSTLLLLALLCALVDFACAAEFQLNVNDVPLREMTNAERLAKGLPPKKPRYRRAGDNRLKPSGGLMTSVVPTPSNSIVVPTPTNPSSPDCPEVTGTIQVSSEDGTLAGFLSSPNEEGLYGYTADASAAAKFKYSSCAPIPFDITGEATQIENSVFQLVGGVEDSRSGCFLVGNVPQTTAVQNLPNPLASILGLASSQVSSAIWNVTGSALLPQLGDDTSNTPAPITYNTGTGLFAFNKGNNCPGTNASFKFASA